MEDKMIKKFKMTGILAGLLIVFFGHTIGAAVLTEPSGELVNGFRVLAVDGAGEPSEWTVFRGDYIKFKVGADLKAPVVSIPSLSLENILAADLEQAPYFKMKKIGKFDVFMVSLVGTLKVVEYNQVNYEAVSAQKAQQVIASFNPIILDVRTPREFSRGHLENSVLIPVQQLQSRMDELAELSDEPILIYCAT
jgi:rhodanese-like protein